MSPEMMNQIFEMSITSLVVALALSVAFGAICGYMAARRGLSWVFWSVMGFAFGPLAVPFIFVGKKKRNADGSTAEKKQH